ncbi:Ig-like domain-containing protein [Robiginitalea marina]|uniref:Ig-like domain-containing protein n=1 Tax=Robiginitalea marina TaxID=2954105 RepID=A0ABT1AW54_9FLAO|nr:Ig-like domain-containing protein [Robiginitalea marina]MCO5724293.1 Ig-like domain-containing protein [Robiginitalea marina]
MIQPRRHLISLGQGLLMLLLFSGATEGFSQKSPPVAADDTYVAGLNAALMVGAATGLLANDTDPNGPGLLVDTNPVMGPSNGTLSLNADGSFTYTPNPGFSGADAFAYRVCDDGTPYVAVSRFDFDTPDLGLATIGPNATSVNPIALQSGCGIRIGSGSGGSTGIDVVVPNTGGIFNFTSFVASFEYRDQESVADLVTAGNFRIWHISGNNLGVEVRVIDGTTGLPATYSQNLGAFLSGNNPYTVEYDEVSGTVIYTTTGGTTTFNVAPPFSPLNTALAGDITLGRFMDNSGSGQPSLCSMELVDSSRLCDSASVALSIPAQVITNRRITYRVNRN